MFQTESNSQISRISTGYQLDIKAFCTRDIMSCHPLVLCAIQDYKSRKAVWETGTKDQRRKESILSCRVESVLVKL